MPELAFQRYIFEIGIYPCSADEFYDLRHSELEKHLQWLTDQSGGSTKNEAPSTFAHAEIDFMRRYGNWRYSQAIGWLRLYILGTQIRGETWFIDAKRITRTMKERKFSDFGKTFELEFKFEKISSIDIYKAILLELEELIKEVPYKGHYLDLEAFYNLAPFVNWRQIMGLE
jgi:hypothetical protein